MNNHLVSEKNEFPIYIFIELLTITNNQYDFFQNHFWSSDPELLRVKYCLCAY